MFILLQRLGAGPNNSSQTNQHNVALSPTDSTVSKEKLELLSPPSELNLSSDLEAATSNHKEPKHKESGKPLDHKLSDANKKETSSIGSASTKISTRDEDELKKDMKMGTGEWDMFADQDHFETIDVSCLKHFFFKQKGTDVLL